MTLPRIEEKQYSQDVFIHWSDCDVQQVIGGPGPVSDEQKAEIERHMLANRLGKNEAGEKYA